MCRVWSDTGFLSVQRSKPLLGIGLVDFAGTTVIHMVGGVTAFVSVYFCGPRLGRFSSDGTVNPGWRGHSTPLVVIGTFILWTGYATSL
jgi:Amt family ammonium transporter